MITVDQTVNLFSDDDTMGDFKVLKVIAAFWDVATLRSGRNLQTFERNWRI